VRRLAWLVTGALVFAFLLVVDTGALLHLLWIGLRSVPHPAWFAFVALIGGAFVLRMRFRRRKVALKRRKGAKPRLRKTRG